MQESSQRFLDEWAEPLIFCALAVVCVFIYGQTVRFDFINLDDSYYVYRNNVVLSGINRESVEWAFTAVHSSNWHPLTWLSHSLDVQLFGVNPGAHHAVNVTLHLLNACLAFIVFRSYTGAIWKSALVALLFAAHPAHVESVAWISERKDVLSTLFWLFTMLAYFWYARSSAAEASIAKRFTSPFFILTFIVFAFGLMAKPMLVTLPLVLLLLDLWPLKRASDMKSLIPLVIEKFPLFVLSAASSFITYAVQKAGGSLMEIDKFPLESRSINSLLAYINYIFELFYPKNLGVYYPFEPYIDRLTFVTYLALFVSITVIALWQLKKRTYIAVGWFWFVGTLVPVIGLVQVGAQSMADRYTYIPYFGLFIVIVWGASELVEKFEIDKRVATAVAALVIVVLSITAFNQAGFWRNSETLYLHSTAVTKNNYLLMNLLCRHYIDRTPVENAERRCTELLDKTSNYMESHNTIGLLRAELGRYDDALASYQKALQIRPDTGIVYLNISRTYSKKGDIELAEKNLQRALEIRDESLNAEALAYSYNALGEAFALKNETANARKAYEAALQYQPELSTAKENLAKLEGAK